MLYKITLTYLLTEAKAVRNSPSTGHTFPQINLTCRQ